MLLRLGRLARLVLLIAVAAQLAGTAVGQNVDELKQLLDQLRRALDAEQYDFAQKQAHYLLATAEKTFRTNPAVLANFYNVVGDLYAEKSQRYADAEPYYAREVQLLQAAHGRWTEAVADALHTQGDTVYYQKKYIPAAALYRQALEIRQRVLGQNHLDTAQSWRELGYTFYMASQYDKAAQCYDQVIAIRERLLGPNHERVADAVHELANVRYYQNQYEPALKLYERSLAIRQRALGEESLDVALSYLDLGDCLHSMSRLAEAEANYRRAFEIREAISGEASDTAEAMRRLGNGLIDLARYDEADALFKRALAIDESQLGADTSEVASALEGLARVRYEQGRYAEAEPLYRRALSIRERMDPPNPASIASVCNHLSSLCLELGHYADGEKLARRALALSEENLAADDPRIANSLNRVGVALRRQGRNREAEPFYRRALELREQQLSPTDPEVAASLQNMAGLLVSLGDSARAEPLFNRARDIYRQVYGENSSAVAYCNSSLADLYWEDGRKEEAQQLYAEVLAALEAELGLTHPDLAVTLYDMAWCSFDTDDLVTAQKLLDRAVDIDRQFPLSPQTAFRVYVLRARVHRQLDRKSEATRDLEHAMQIAEQLRGSSAGAELERADFFAGFSSAFERMVAWQMEDGDVERALEAIERSRARSLLDEISLSGADINAGRPIIEEEQQRQADAELRALLAEQERALQKVLEASEPDTAERDRLTQEIATTREKLYQQYRDARSSSVIYQNLLSRSAKLPSLGEIQRQHLDGDGLLLVYLLGGENGYVIAVGENSADLFSLAIGDDLAETLGCEAGPLTADRLQQVLLAESGVMPLLANPEPSPELTKKLSALWTVLIPEQFQAHLTEGKCSRLIVVPNGPLSFLPFETLVTSSDEAPVYLLDKGPPVSYAPSVTVLDSLRIRNAVSLAADREPVLTVGDPDYGSAEGAAAARSVLIRGQLAALPNSGVESQWVSDVFGKQGIAAVRLVKEDATEANVREGSAGRRLLHLACHGMTDQAHGNLFGSLALTPGPNPDEEPGDDGFLSLAEIYELNLRGCELAILSACETNYGPDQKGEGIWTLSRGFLVAGTRRVVASNWVVDDEAAANLVSYFCAGLAKAEAEGEKRAYGRALLDAKRQIRQQEKWQAPYFWASMVLIGPP